MYRQARVAERRPPRAPRVLAPSVRSTEVVVLLLAAVAAPVGRNICAVAVRVVALLGVDLLVERSAVAAAGAAAGAAGRGAG